MQAPIEVQNTADRLAQLVSTATQTAIMAATNESKNKLDAVLIAATGAIGAIHVLSQLIGWHGDKDRNVGPENVGKLSNTTSRLLAAILVNQMSPDVVPGRDGQSNEVGMMIEFSPDIMWSAIQRVESIIGKPVDGFVDPQMLDSLKDIIAKSNDPMNKFLAQRRSTPGSLH